MTERIVREMQRQFSLRVFDIGKNGRPRGRRWQLKKLIRSVFSALRIFSWKRRGQERLYLVLNSASGLIYNLAQVIAGRGRGFEMVVHHHVWSYLSKRDWRMDLIIRFLGDNAVHVVACPEMASALEKVYARRLRFAYVTPGIVGLPEQSEPDNAPNTGGRAFRLGMLSNLTIEKGLGDAIETFAELRRRDRDVELILAGPAAEPEARRRIADAQQKYGDRIHVLGPVYGDEKTAFYREIDAFLFPTRYRNESWGIVLNEALMAGVPVITLRRGCIGYLVGKTGGTLAAHDNDYVETATSQIEHWIKEPAQYAKATGMARSRGNELREEAEAQLTCFLDGFQTGHWPTPMRHG
ncbi:glycosyltransferase family 4 protein [Rhodopirellula halodulae]|uniref:glycosyltransferase family 4 protein n=1 Tax=Rhodopirellula halodulae TaxID=2894198 RepID=UPI001E636091|nr:glycosyltransferase family 4 protein [Rhodopirellula sp. JC737]MCC9654430.1 glycosyltransferase family 4 protein [Rhodopirellula sp. JC737]